MMQHKMSQTSAATSHIRLLVDGRQTALCGHSEQHTVQFGSGLSTNPDKAIICLLLRFELQAHPLLFSFQFPRISAERLYGETGSKCAFARGNFFRGRKRGSERKRENRVRVCHMSQKSLFIAVFHFSSQTRRRGDRLKSFIQTSMIRQNI